MKKLVLPLAAALFALPFPAHAGASGNVAWDIVEGLTTEVGQRHAGTEAEARARAWGVAKLKALGFSNVRIETYRMPVWVRGDERAKLTAPFPQPLAITALGNSGSTGPKGMKGTLVVFPTYESFKAAPDEAIRGRIVYVGHAMKPAQDGSSYGYYGIVRRSGPNLAAKRGAAAFIIRSIGTDNHRNPHTGNTNWDEGVKPIPAAAVSNPDANLIELADARAPGKIEIDLLLTPKFIGVQESGNVIAEVPGSDPAAGIVLVGGHLDSWDLGTGAIDDGAGVAITAAAAKAVLDSGRQPRRTIRVIWWGSEEVGQFGGKSYWAAHRLEPHAFTAESDFGADRIWRYDVKLPEPAKAIGERLGVALSPLGIAGSRIPAGGGADNAMLVADGVPVIDLQQDGTRYFDIHHTPDDTLDKIDPDQLAQNVKAWTIMLDLLANAPEDLLAGQKK